MFLKIFPCKGTVGNEPVEKILTTLKPIKDQPNKLEEMKNSGWDFRSYMSNVKMENLSLSRGTIHILRKHLYSTKLNLMTKLGFLS